MQNDSEETLRGRFAVVKVGAHLATLLRDPMAGDDMGIDYNRASCIAGIPAIVGATYAHCIDERIPALSGYGTFCASVGADALFAAREVNA